ncbi:MAG: hypothetical protein ACLP36_04460 [Acidimicrobiales bacterium]
MQLARVRRSLDETGAYLTAEGVRFTGLAAKHRIDKEMRCGGYVPENDWQGHSRIYKKKETETVQ